MFPINSFITVGTEPVIFLKPLLKIKFTFLTGSVLNVTYGSMLNSIYLNEDETVVTMGSHLVRCHGRCHRFLDQQRLADVQVSGGHHEPASSFFIDEFNRV